MDIQIFHRELAGDQAREEVRVAHALGDLPGFKGSLHLHKARSDGMLRRWAGPAQSLESIVGTSQDRNEAIRRAYASAAYSVTEIAQYFGVHISTASRIARSLDANLETPRACLTPRAR